VVGSLDVDTAAELLVRVAVSFVLVRDTALPIDDDEEAADLARRLIAPMLM
jgi:hypothetical protein